MCTELDRNFHEKILENISSGIKEDPTFFFIPLSACQFFYEAVFI